MPRWHVRRLDRIEAWIEHADPPVSARKAVYAWLAAAVTGPREVANDAFRRAGTLRVVYVAVIPGADVIVTYSAGEAPVRVITIISVVDAP